MIYARAPVADPAAPLPGRRRITAYRRNRAPETSGRSDNSLTVRTVRGCEPFPFPASRSSTMAPAPAVEARTSPPPPHAAEGLRQASQCTCELLLGGLVGRPSSAPTANPSRPAWLFRPPRRASAVLTPARNSLRGGLPVFRIVELGLGGKLHRHGASRPGPRCCSPWALTIARAPPRVAGKSLRTLP